MSVRSIFTSRMGLSTAGAVARTSQIGSQVASAQLARLHSTAVRPSCAIQNQDPRPHVRVSTISQRHPAGLRAQSTSAAAKNEVKLDWDSFFKLRASRRRYSLSSSIISSLVSTSVGVQVLSSQDLESLGAQVMGLDPFVVLGMATAACGAIGWLVGPAVGNGVWGLVYRRYKPSVATVRLSPTLFKAWI